jgi:hypothetical protein
MPTRSTSTFAHLLAVLERILTGRPPTGPVWRVAIEAHDVPPRWRIEAQVVEVRAIDVAHARTNGIREAHRRAELPPYKPLLRTSWPHATAEPVEAASLPVPARLAAQLTIDAEARAAA